MIGNTDADRLFDKDVAGVLVDRQKVKEISGGSSAFKSLVALSSKYDKKAGKAADPLFNLVQNNIMEKKMEKKMEKQEKQRKKLEKNALHKLKSIELARIKKWENNLKRSKREALRRQAGLANKSAEEIKRGLIGKIGLGGGGNGGGSGSKGKSVPKERKISQESSISYVDKTRATAVGTDGFDLTAELKKKLKVKQEVQEKSEWIIFYNEGTRNLSRDYMMPAMVSFNKAVQRQPEREEPHIGRSECWLRLGKPEEALASADAAIKCYKDRKAEELKPPMPGQEVAKPTKVQLIREMVALSGALFCKAEALYALHRFEKSLIYYNQCINMRPTEHSFKAKYLAGRERCTVGIMNSLSQSCFDNPSAIAEIARKNQKRFQKAAKVIRNPLFGKKAPVVKSVMMKSVMSGAAKQAKEGKKSEVLRGLERYRRQVRECAAGVGSRGRNLCVDSDFAAVLAVEMRELRVDPGTSGVVNEVCKYLERRRRFWENMDPGYMMLGAKKRRGRKAGGDSENMAGASMLRIKGY